MERTIWQTYQNEDFIFLGINFVENEETVRDFVDNFGLRFPILLDSRGRTYRAYQIERCRSPFPQDYIIDRNGRIAYKACEYFPDSMVAVIEDLLAGDGEPETTEDPLDDGLAAGFPQIELVHPNPIRGSGSISFILPSSGMATVDILDVSGRRVQRVLHSSRGAGPNVVAWDGRDSSGRLTPAGIYLVRVSALGRSSSRKIMLVR
jgi:hypothetical protein